MHLVGILGRLDQALEPAVSLVVEISVVSLLGRNVGSPQRPWIHVLVHSSPHVGADFSVGDVSLLAKSVLVSLGSGSVHVVWSSFLPSVGKSISLLVGEPVDVLLHASFSNILLVSLSKSGFMSLGAGSVHVVWSSLPSDVGKSISLLVGEPMNVLLHAGFSDVSLLLLDVLGIRSHALPRELVDPWVVVYWANWVNSEVSLIWDGVSSFDSSHVDGGSDLISLGWSGNGWRLRVWMLLSESPDVVRIIVVGIFLRVEGGVLSGDLGLEGVDLLRLFVELDEGPLILNIVEVVTLHGDVLSKILISVHASGKSGGLPQEEGKDES